MKAGIKKPKIVIVAGPTASGKSDLAIKLARRFDGEIISADSRQVYRGMDIGTGKVTKTQQRLVPHHLLDVCSPKRQYSAGKWKRAAQRAITDITARGKVPVICGGTGFWIDALVYDFGLPEVSDRTVRARLDKVPTDKLFLHLQILDPVRAATIDPHNRRRLIRALEIVLLTGKPVPPRTNGSPYEPLYLGVSVPKTVLARRIARRLDSRLRHGMVAEVRRLHRQGVSWNRLEAFGLEYRWLARFLQKKITRTEMRDGLLRDIVAYAKRQMTWFRKNHDIVWISTFLDAKRKTVQYLPRRQS